MQQQATPSVRELRRRAHGHDTGAALREPRTVHCGDQQALKSAAGKAPRAARSAARLRIDSSSGSREAALSHGAARVAVRKPQTGRGPPSGRPTISRGEEPPSGHGPHHPKRPRWAAHLLLRGRTGRPPGHATTATAAQDPAADPVPLPRAKKVEPEPERPRALRQRREHTVTWPGPGLTGVSAGHGTRLKSPQIAGWIPSDETPAARLREIERENAELVRFIGRSRPSPAMERPQIPRAGGGRGVLPDRLDREARPVVSPSRPARPRRRPVAARRGGAAAGRLRALPRGGARRRQRRRRSRLGRRPRSRASCGARAGRRAGTAPQLDRPAGTPSPRPGVTRRPHTPSLRREASEASAFEHGRGRRRRPSSSPASSRRSTRRRRRPS